MGSQHRGKEVLRAYQMEGLGPSGGTERWRLSNVADFSELRPVGRPFAQPCHRFNPLDPAMPQMHYHVLVPIAHHLSHPYNPVSF
jgi:hypothetical protein